MTAMQGSCVLIIALSGACSYTKPADVGEGPGDGHLPGDGHGSGVPDAAHLDAANLTCRAMTAYGSVVPSQAEQFAIDVSAAPHELIWTGIIDASEIRASFQLTAGVGPFVGGDIHGGNFTLGAEQDLSHCGVCVALIHTNGSQVDDYYVATGGSLTLTTITGMVVGNLDDATFTRVEISSGQPTTTFDPSCKSTLQHVTINMNVTQQ